MLVAYTCGGQMSKGHAYTPVAYTCAVDKCLKDILKCCSHTPALGECLKGAPPRWSHRPAVGKCVKEAPTRWSPTPAVGKCQRDEPTYSPGSLQVPLEAFGSLLVPSVESNSPKTAKTPKFFDLPRLIERPTGDEIQNGRKHSVRPDPDPIPTKFR